MGRINITNIEDKANADASLWNSRYSIISEVINGNLDADNLATNAVETAKIKDSAVTTDKISDGAITADKLDSNAIVTDTIVNGSITLDKINTALRDAIYPIGSIFTAAVSTNPATLIGFGTWEAFGAGRVLVGRATSGTFVTGGATGGAETIKLTAAQSGLVSHTHTQNSHTHTQNSHNHTQNSHNHTQDSHNHTQNQHRHAEGSWGVQGRQPGFPKYNTEWSAGYQFNDYVTNTGYTTPTNNATTATNNAATATNKSTTATNNNATATNNAVSNMNAASAHDNLQPYVVVYYWRRTA